MLRRTISEIAFSLTFENIDGFIRNLIWWSGIPVDAFAGIESVIILSHNILSISLSECFFVSFEMVQRN